MSTQTGLSAVAQEIGISSFDELSNTKICELMVKMQAIDLAAMGLNSCSDLNAQRIFDDMNAIMASQEGGVDMAAFGIRSFDDFNERTFITLFNNNIKSQTGVDLQAEFGVSSIDDLSATKVVGMLEKLGVPLDEAQKVEIGNAFPESQSSLQIFREEGANLMEILGLYSANGASSLLASTVAAVSTAVVAFSF